MLLSKKYLLKVVSLEIIQIPLSRFKHSKLQITILRSENQKNRIIFWIKSLRFHLNFKIIISQFTVLTLNQCQSGEIPNCSTNYQTKININCLSNIPVLWRGNNYNVDAGNSIRIGRSNTIFSKILKIKINMCPCTDHIVIVLKWKNKPTVENVGNIFRNGET